MLSIIKTACISGNSARVTSLRTLPGIISEWMDGILWASPKKKTSHMKKRSRMLGPHSMKNAQPWNDLNRCPSCGHIKRAHTLCMYCVGQIRYIWKNHLIKEEAKGNSIEQAELDPVDKRVIYPGRTDTPYIKKLKDKDSYLTRRKRTLRYERDMRE